MNRRKLLATLAAMPATSWSAGTGRELDNPYAAVDWDTWECVHSMSHQHQGQNDASRDGFLGMGYGHFAFSNYYPSAPTYPLPAEYAAKHPQLVAAPNAEHHSYTDTGLHANALGSLLATGYGGSVSAAKCAAAPVLHRFENLNVFDAQKPWLGVYRLDLRLAAKEGKAMATLSVEGAHECDFRNGFADKGPVHERQLPSGSHTIYLRATRESIDARLDFDAAAISVTQYRLMQGTNRPWRDVFREAFSKLQYPDGGGMTLNHPTGKLADYLPMLDFDPRVLGIEVWNQLTSGFGSSRGFYDDSGEPNLHFYQLWDEILRKGRRCWGFFVKDHNTYGRGRNVLLVPKLDAMPAAKRESAALRAYRQGTFFGSVASLAASEAGEVVAPYDRSGFCFSRIVVQNDTLQVAVAGNDAKRPRLQIRFITDQGIASIVDGAQAEFPLKRDGSGRLEAAFVRVEAFAYPETHQRGQPLTADMLRGMSVHDISLLHDQKALRGPAFANTSPAMRTPIPIVDMIFSQPLRRV
ncbi:MAG: hypothetical protein J0L73_26295 [Verrucomicrobia bacterium]|nr:hypothetical protein [Verrucomicrobiota bacterium]